MGLPYVADAAITRHLSAFVSRNEQEIRKFQTKPTHSLPCPNTILFNGGVFQASLLRDRILQVVGSWTEQPIKELSAAGLHQAVAIGAAYYGMVRRGKHFVSEEASPARTTSASKAPCRRFPECPDRFAQVCVVPQGTEEGTEMNLRSMPFGLVVGEEVEFRFLGSSIRKEDKVGTVVDDWEGEIDDLAPIRTTIEPKASQKKGDMIPVLLHGKVTEVGTLELWCQSRDTDDRWKLEFNVREQEG